MPTLLVEVPKIIDNDERRVSREDSERVPSNGFTVRGARRTRTVKQTMKKATAILTLLAALLAACASSNNNSAAVMIPGAVNYHVGGSGCGQALARSRL
jgi:hypothetical protein